MMYLNKFEGGDKIELMCLDGVLALRNSDARVVGCTGTCVGTQSVDGLTGGSECGLTTGTCTGTGNNRGTKVNRVDF